MSAGQTPCEECGRLFDYLDLVRQPALAAWSPRKMDVCPRCADAISHRLLVQRVWVAVIALIAVVLIVDLLQVTVGF